MRILLSLLFLAHLALGQGDALFAVPLSEREALLDKLDELQPDDRLAKLKDLARRIEAGKAEAAKQTDEAFQKALTEAVTEQGNALATLTSAWERAERTLDQVNKEIAALKSGQPPSRISPATVDTSDDLAFLRQWQKTVTGKHDDLKAELTAKTEALKELTDGSTAALTATRGVVTQARDDWSKEKKAVVALETSQAAPPELWPAREDAFKKLIELRTGERNLAVQERETLPAMLSLRVEKRRLERQRADDAVKAAAREVEAISARITTLTEAKKDERRTDRAYLEQALGEAPAHARPFLEMQIGILDAQSHKDDANRVQGEWTARLATGLLEIALGEVKAVADDLEDEDLGLSTDELAVLLEENEARLERVRSAVSELASVRRLARRGQREAIGLGRTLARDYDEDALLAAAREADAAPEDFALWTGLTESYRAAVEEWKQAEINLWTTTEDEFKRLSDAQDSLEDSVTKLRSRLLWSREDSLISTEALKQAFSDATTLPEHVSETVGETKDDWWATATAPENRGRLVAMAVLVVVLGTLFWFIHKRLPATYSWLETRDGEDAGLWKIVGTGVRRSEFVFLLGLFYCGLCAVWGIWPWATGALAVLALTPFCYRFLRVVLDVLFHPTDPADRLIDVDNVLAGILHRAGRWLLNVSLVFVGLGLLMETGGYEERNPGFIQFWWFLYTTAFSIILLVGVCRPSVIRKMIRGEGQVAASMKTLVLVLYPIVVSAVLFLLVLNALRYHEAVDYFATRLLVTVGIVAVAVLVYRGLLRRLLPNRDWARFVRPEDYDEQQQFMAQGRRWFWDMLARSGLRLAVLIPALIILAGVWRRMDWTFLDVPLFGQDGKLTGEGLLLGVIAIWATVATLKHYRRWLRFVVLPATKLDQGLGYAVLTLTSYVVVAVGTVISLNLLHVQGDQIAFVLSALMIGIGFGLKELVTNFISGIMLLVERPLKVGDQVVIGDAMGTVEKINLRSTTIMTFDNVGVVVPNADLVTGKLINRSSGTPLLRTTVPVGVGYDSDVRQVMEIIQGCLDDHGLVLKKPGPSIYFVGFGDNSLDFSVRFWARMSDNRMQIAGDLRAAMLARFRDADIEIPFPQRDLHLRSTDADAVVRTADVKPPKGPRKVSGGDGADVMLPQQPSDEDAQRAAAEEVVPESVEGETKGGQ